MGYRIKYYLSHSNRGYDFIFDPYQAQSVVQKADISDAKKKFSDQEDSSDGVLQHPLKTIEDILKNAQPIKVTSKKGRSKIFEKAGTFQDALEEALKIREKLSG